MSMAALLLSTKDFILNNIKLNEEDITEVMCDIMPDGRPTANAGEVFISIHSGSIRNTSYEVLDCLLGINLTVTYRIARIPQDRVGTEIIANQSLPGIEELVQLLIEGIHMNQRLINLANSLIDSSKNRFVEPLRFSICSPPRIVSGDWFHAADSKEVGLIQTVSFENARRVQWGTNHSFIEDVFTSPVILPSEVIV